MVETRLSNAHNSFWVWFNHHACIHDASIPKQSTSNSTTKQSWSKIMPYIASSLYQNEEINGSVADSTTQMIQLKTVTASSLLLSLAGKGRHMIMWEFEMYNITNYRSKEETNINCNQGSEKQITFLGRKLKSHYPKEVSNKIDIGAAARKLKT